MLRPVYTEKSMKDAKNGVYTFWVNPTLTKGQIKSMIAKSFEVKVGSVKTLNYKRQVKKNWKGTKVARPAMKKALVTLLGKDKIGLFEEGKK